MQGLNGSMQAAQVQVIATSGRGHSVEQIADLCLVRIIGVADTAPEAIRLQAYAFREAIRPVLVYYMNQAIRSNKTTLYNQLREAGQHEAAEVILKV